MVLTFESVDEIQWCDHSSEAFPEVLSHGIICFSAFYNSDHFGRHAPPLWSLRDLISKQERESETGTEARVLTSQIKSHYSPTPNSSLTCEVSPISRGTSRGPKVYKFLELSSLTISKLSSHTPLVAMPSWLPQPDIYSKVIKIYT